MFNNYIVNPNSVITSDFFKFAGSHPYGGLSYTDELGINRIYNDEYLANNRFIVNTNDNVRCRCGNPSCIPVTININRDTHDNYGQNEGEEINYENIYNKELIRVNYKDNNLDDYEYLMFKMSDEYLNFLQNNQLCDVVMKVIINKSSDNENEYSLCFNLSNRVIVNNKLIFKIKKNKKRNHNFKISLEFYDLHGHPIIYIPYHNILFLVRYENILQYLKCYKF